MYSILDLRFSSVRRMWSNDSCCHSGPRRFIEIFALYDDEPFKRCMRSDKVILSGLTMMCPWSGMIVMHSSQQNTECKATRA